MNQSWQVHREIIAQADGQRRWDRAYQLLLRWADETLPASSPLITQEDDHACCRVCPGLDQSPTADPHD